MNGKTLQKRCTWLWAVALIVVVLTALGGLLLTWRPVLEWDRVPFAWFRVTGDGTRLAGPSWLAAFWPAISFSGDTGPRVVVAIVALAGLWLARRWRSACLFAWVLISGVGLTDLLKAWVDRPRPEIVAHLVEVGSPSFPSGHALNATLFYLGVALLYAPLLRQRWLRWVVYVLAAVLALATGVARVALGVHYPSDVIAGWIIGAAWLGLWWALAARYWPAAFANVGTASSRV